MTARVYYGTGDNVQYQVDIFGITPAGAWVGLKRAYYGTGLQYNAQTQIGGTPVRWIAG